MPALVSVVLGIALGYASGGSLDQLGSLRLRLEGAILPLFLVQALSRGRFFGLVGASSWSLGVWAASSVLLVVALVVNWNVPGMALGGAAILMNLDVVLLNSAMPVLLGAVGPYSSVASADMAHITGGFYRIAGSGDLWMSAGDSMPVVFGRSVTLVSPGDVVLAVAVVAAIVYGMTSVARLEGAKRFSESGS